MCEGLAAGARESLHAQLFRVGPMKAGPDGHQDGGRVCSTHLDRLFRRCDHPTLGDDPGADLQRDSVMARAVHALPGMAVKYEIVATAGAHRRREDALAEFHAKCDMPRMTAGETNGQHAVRMGGENLSSEQHTVAS